MKIVYPDGTEQTMIGMDERMEELRKKIAEEMKETTSTSIKTHEANKQVKRRKKPNDSTRRGVANKK